MNDNQKDKIFCLMVIALIALTCILAKYEKELQAYREKYPESLSVEKIKLPDELFFRGDVVAHVLTKQTLGMIIDKKGQNNHWTYKVRVVTNSVFSEVWLAEEELLLVEESKRGNRPHHTKPAQRL